MVGEREKDYIIQIMRREDEACKRLLRECTEDAPYFTRNTEDQADLAQETALRTILSINSFDPKISSLRTWRRAIERHIAQDMGRKKKRKAHLFTDLKIEEDYCFEDSIADRRPERQIDRLILREKLDYIAYGENTISREERDLLITRHGYGREIGFKAATYALDELKNTLKSRESRTRKRLTNKWGD